MESNREYNLARYACFLSSASMSVVLSLSPLLFATFRDTYGVSYTLLGLLVLINFSTQLIIDLVFTFFSKHFNIHKTVRSMPVITFLGLLIYALMPDLMPQMTYFWLALGTAVFSVGAGLGEVLFSPLFAAIPSENPEREMSKLHSVYAWGVVVVVIVSTLFLKAIGTHNWKYLALMWGILPLSASVMFFKAKLPEIHDEEKRDKTDGKLLNTGVLICLLCIFLGGAAECTMNQWISGFIEKAVGIPKVIGDIFGMALFALFLGLGRTIYSKKGKNIINVMLCGMIGASVCYIAAGLSLNPFINILACVATGFAASMLWPGTIIYVGEKFKSAGVAVYALMAAGGDAGASVAPQLVGIAADKIATSSFALSLAEKLSITAEQIGMRAAVLGSALFPICGVIVICIMKKYFKRK